ncbi:two-component system sensor histidine kinase NtrB [Desulfonema magnum]|nr:ATP-binding protein [Desulfonema magnum]
MEKKVISLRHKKIYTNKNNQLKILVSEVEELRSELNDLKLILEAVTGHSDEIEACLLEKVRAGDRLFHVISKTIPVPFVISRKDNGSILFSNSYAEKVFKLSHEGFSLNNLPDIYDDPDESRRFLTCLSDQGRIENFEVKLRKSDGTLFWASLFSQSVSFRGKDCLLTVVFDLTERKQAEKEKLILERQLRQVQKMEAMGTFAGGIAHDFNGILTIILGNLQLAQSKLTDDSPVGKYLKDAVAATTRGTSLITQILTFCRQTKEEKKPFRISSVVSEAAQMIQSLIPSKINVCLSIKTAMPIIIGDPTHIHQILMNLCANAVHAMEEEGGAIDIILENISINPETEQEKMIFPLKTRAYARLTVRDNGPGIDKEIMDRIFEPFFTTKAPGQGSGMGLSIVHGIVQRNGGTVTVESESGKGTAFYCYFPLISDEK